MTCSPARLKRTKPGLRGKMLAADRRKAAQEGESRSGLRVKKREVVSEREFGRLGDGRTRRPRRRSDATEPVRLHDADEAHPHIVDRGSAVYTDDYVGCSGVERVYRHYRINYSDIGLQLLRRDRVVDATDVVVHEGEEAPDPLNEYAWRYNHRDDGVMIVRLPLRAVVAR